MTGFDIDNVALQLLGTVAAVQQVYSACMHSICGRCRGVDWMQVCLVGIQTSWLLLPLPVGLSICRAVLILLIVCTGTARTEKIATCSSSSHQALHVFFDNLAVLLLCMTSMELDMRKRLALLVQQCPRRVASPQHVCRVLSSRICVLQCCGKCR